MSKVSFTSWMKLNIAGEGEITFKRRIDQKLASVKCTLIFDYVAILYSGLFWMKKTCQATTERRCADVQMSVPSERRLPLENQCTVIYSVSNFTVICYLLPQQLPSPTTTSIPTAFVFLSQFLLFSIIVLQLKSYHHHHGFIYQRIRVPDDQGSLR